MLRIYKIIGISLVSVLLFSLTSFAKPLLTIDYSGHKDGSAQSWLKKQGYKLESDADDIKLYFKNSSLVFETNETLLGLITYNINVKQPKRIRITWGVNKYPKGANWDQGMFRESLSLIISFGNKKWPSGSFVIPNMPPFFSFFLGEKEQVGKAYKGNYYKKGGRFFCIPCNSQTNQDIITEFELKDNFKRYYKINMPDIFGLAFEVDTRDTDGKAKAYIKKIEFLSE